MRGGNVTATRLLIRRRCWIGPSDTRHSFDRFTTGLSISVQEQALETVDPDDTFMTPKRICEPSWWVEGIIRLLLGEHNEASCCRGARWSESDLCMRRN